MPPVVYKDGFRFPNIGPKGNRPGDAQALGVWRAPWYLCERNIKPTVSVTVGVRLSEGEDETQEFDWTDAFLRVIWGTGSGDIDKQVMDLDLIDGTGFAAPAVNMSFYLVYPIIDLSGINNGKQPNIDVNISIGAGGGVIGGPRGARRTVVVGATTAGNPSTPQPIPPFAVGAVLQTSDATAAATLTQLRAPANASQILSVSTIQKQEYQSVPIAHGARGFEVTTVANAAGVRVLFYLSPTA